ncbi:cell division protein FtsQ/DivIB [Fibrella forsythiae]|uniref:FtsQ-type POTRA domain-containing protein n=1 Tax=Fibrella forsythiae TaxID=2817061 RepID=A0ABS3JKD8_9BACT|nr:cell division protein FtsQ/DivIB [Fibrella forsythiae]MBO0950468.1 FtsQ-type POTRA domain-containing protein [Fibrella forsythiae]
MFSTFSNRKKWIWRSMGVLTLFGLLAFTEERLHQRHCEAIVVNIDKVDGQRFLTRRDVTGFLTNNGNDPLVGQSFDEINLSKLEQRLGQYSLIKQAHVSRDLAGNLLVQIEQPSPLARLVADGDGLRAISGQYISDEGRFFPLSMNYTARVPIVSGSWFQTHHTLADEAGKPLLTLLQYIRESDLWRAQIAEVSVDQSGNVTLWPQVGNYQIDFGTADAIETKFKKVKLFYTQIAPQKGWDRYHRVSVQYRNQLVCE